MTVKQIDEAAEELVNQLGNTEVAVIEKALRIFNQRYDDVVPEFKITFREKHEANKNRKAVGTTAVHATSGPKVHRSQRHSC